jgi:HAD superfamily hydrolase (TIGR01509 family)
VSGEDRKDGRADGRPQGAIFDCDGLLVDTRRCWATAYRAAAEEAGAALRPDRLDSLCESLNGASVGIAAERLGRALGRKISAEFMRGTLIEAVGTEPLRPLPGAERLLAALEGRLPLAVASNAPVAVVEMSLQAAGLDHYFGHVVSAEEVAAPKPDPGVYLEACRRLSIEPAEAVAFEDSPLGAAAVRAAGIFLVAIPVERTAGFEAEVMVSSLWDPKVLAVLGLDRPTNPGVCHARLPDRHRSAPSS